MNVLSQLLSLPEREKEERGLVFTPREITQQPDTWSKSFQMVYSLHHRVKEFLESAGIGAEEKHRPRVVLIGAGTSHYVGESLTQLIRKRWQCDVQAIPSTDLLTSMDELIAPAERYLWISFSRSGDSSEAISVLELALARYPKARHIIICCNREGRMVRQFRDHPSILPLVLDDSVNDRGLAMTSSYSNMVVTGQSLACFSDLTEYEAVLEKLIAAGRSFLAPAAELAAKLAEAQFSKVCFVGTGALRAVAQESALKVLELTGGKIHTMSDTYLGIRHGPLSAINDDTLWVSFLSGNQRLRGYEADLLQEVKNKGLGRARVVVAPEDAPQIRGLADYFIPLANSAGIPDECRAPVDVMFGQLLGLFTSLRHGLKPDTPSPNGAISRVVCLVKIYE